MTRHIAGHVNRLQCIAARRNLCDQCMGTLGSPQAPCTDHTILGAPCEEFRHTPQRVQLHCTGQTISCSVIADHSVTPPCEALVLC